MAPIAGGHDCAWDSSFRNDLIMQVSFVEIPVSGFQTICCAADAFFKWVEAPVWRWGPLLLLAIYASMDFSAQYLLAATALPTVLPPDVREFLKVCSLNLLAQIHLQIQHII